MDKAMSGKIGKKWAAILAGCVWAIFALAASVAFRTVTAKALSINDEITVKAKLDPSIEGSEDGEHTWGKFYRGITLLTTANYKMDGVQSSVSIDTSGDPTVSIDVTDSSSPLNPSGHEHDFISGVPKDKNDHWESTTNGHYAVCSDSSCGFRLEVAHRPALDGSGKCADCGEPLGDDYINKYSFTLPDDTITWDPNSGATIEITINHIYLFAGFVLKLNMSCAGALQTQNGATISYTVAVSTENVTATTYTPTGGSGAETIWQLSAANNLSGSDMRTNINSGSITVTLTPSGGGDSSSAYAGTYTDTLTFSVTLETE